MVFNIYWSKKTKRILKETVHYQRIFKNHTILPVKSLVFHIQMNFIFTILNYFRNFKKYLGFFLKRISKNENKIQYNISKRIQKNPWQSEIISYYLKWCQRILKHFIESHRYLYCILFCKYIFLLFCLLLASLFHHIARLFFIDASCYWKLICHMELKHYLFISNQTFEKREKKITSNTNEKSHESRKELTFP